MQNYVETSQYFTENSYIYIYIYIYIVIKRGDSTQAHLYKYRTMYIVQVYITVISYTKNSLFFLIMTSLS